MKTFLKLSEYLVSHGYRDKAVFYSLLARITTIGLGPIIIISVGAFLDAREQGVYYVFGSLLQLKGLVDLGFSQSTQQLLANRFGKLAFNREHGVSGNDETKNKYLSLAKLTVLGYAGIGLITFTLIGSLGYWFLNTELTVYTEISWKGPWWIMIFSISVGLSFSCVLVIAESANLVALSNRSKFWTELIAIVLFLLVITCGGGLWASATIAFARIWVFVPISRYIGLKIRSQILNANAMDVHFRRTIWPLQSRNIVVWGLGFFCYYTYNPLSLKFLGPADAGAVGMSIQIASTTSAFALLWYNTKIPKLGNLAGSDCSDGAMKLQSTGIKVSCILWVLTAFSIWSIIALIRPLSAEVQTKLAPIGDLALFLLGAGAYAWNHTRASFIRAYCLEVFSLLAIVQSSVTLVMLFTLLPAFGISGAAVTYFVVMLIGAIWSEVAYTNFVKSKIFK